MYHNYFGLTEAPFSIAPNPEYLFMTERHQEALVHLFHSIESDAGFVLLTGDVGTGKTTVCRSFLDKLPKDTNAAFILNPFLSGKELLRVICQELDIQNVPEKATLRESTDAIYRHLLNNHAQGKQTVLLIDEAQHLHFKVLELIRLLTNLETDTQKLLKIILVGQPELNDTLEKPELTQLSQRITARYHIHPLSFAETLSYIDYRLRMAGYLSEKKLFPKRIVKKIYTLTQGIPRLINVICDRALLGAYAQNRALVDRKILAKAVQEVRGKHKLNAYHLLIKRGAIAVSLILGLVLLSQMMPLISTLLNDREIALVDQTNQAGQVDAVDLAGSTPLASASSSATAPKLTSAPKLTVEEQPLPTSLEYRGENTAFNSAINKGDNNRGDNNRGDNNSSDKKKAQSYINKAKDNILPLNVKKVIISDFYSHEETALSVLISALIPALKPAVNKNRASSHVNCLSIEADGWQCRSMEAADLADIKQYNRPAVVSITGDLGEIYYAPIIGLTNIGLTDIERTKPYAQLLGPKGKVTMPLAELRQRWGGSITYLWQPPVGFTNYIFFGSNAPLVDWLAKTFAVIDGRKETLAQHNFNTLLKQRVILFQKNNNLAPDGIAGARTVLKLNEKLGIAVTLSTDFSVSIHH